MWRAAGAVGSVDLINPPIRSGGSATRRASAIAVAEPNRYRKILLVQYIQAHTNP